MEEWGSGKRKWEGGEASGRKYKGRTTSESGAAMGGARAHRKVAGDEREDREGERGSVGKRTTSGYVEEGTRRRMNVVSGPEVAENGAGKERG